MFGFSRINWSPEECEAVKSLLRIAAANCPADTDKYIADIDEYLAVLTKEKIQYEKYQVCQKIRNYLEEKFSCLELNWHVMFGPENRIDYEFGMPTEYDCLNVVIKSEADVPYIEEKIKTDFFKVQQ